MLEIDNYNLLKIIIITWKIDPWKVYQCIWLKSLYVGIADLEEMKRIYIPLCPIPLFTVMLL